MDRLTPEERSRLMSKIRGKDTKPELLVRSMLHRAGYRFSLHRKDLPGKPDIVLRKYKTVVFVHGCFWHCHKGCKSAHLPKSNSAFWKRKLERNVANDSRHQAKLAEMGWNVVVVWECELKDPEAVLTQLMAELSRAIPPKAIRYPAADPPELPIAAEGQAEYRADRRNGGRRPG
jgi:DNA mismatch endonuclease (patch repair protein)